MFAAALLHDFDEVLGIEILEDLCALCEGLRARWEGHVSRALPEAKRATRVRFQNGDASVMDWSFGDVVFANSTCFNEEIMRTLAARASLLRPGSFFLTTTFPLPSDEFELLEESKMAQSWGGATMYIQRKKTPEPTATE